MPFYLPLRSAMCPAEIRELLRLDETLQCETAGYEDSGRSPLDLAEK